MFLLSHQTAPPPPSSTNADITATSLVRRGLRSLAINPVA
jgi:hypothetical protein